MTGTAEPPLVDSTRVGELGATGAAGDGSTARVGADVFLSYAREDQVFVRWLDEQLTAQGREVWVDWESIPPSAEWRAEIHRAIEGAGGLIFVVSPDSLASPVCAEELAHAVELNKRIVPVVYRDPGEVETPDAVSSHNWVFCRNEAEHASGLERISEALDTDLDWVHVHTRLLVRALEWDAKHNDSSLLLRGHDLSDAEAEVAAHAEDRPATTALQRRYVLASRQGVTVRLRRLVAIALVAVLAIASLAVVAFIAQGNANRQATLATTRALSANSVAEEASDPQLSLLLAQEAIKRSDTTESERALRQALEDDQLIGTVTGSKRNRGAIQSAVFSAVFSPDGSSMAIAGISGARILTVRARTERTLTNAIVDDAEYSRDGSRLVTAGADHNARIWNVRTGKQLVELQGHTDIVTSAVFSPDGGRLLTASNDGTARIWDSVSGAPLLVLRGHQDIVSRAQFSPDGRRVVTASFDGTAKIWDAATGAVQLTLGPVQETPHNVLSAAFSPDGQHVVTSVNDLAEVWDAHDGHLVTNLVGHIGFVNGASYSPDGTRIVTAGGDSTARIWDVATSRVVSVLRAHTNQVSKAVYDPSGRIVVTASEDGTVDVWESEPNGEGRQPLRIFRSANSVRLTAADISPDGRQVVTASFDNTATIWATDPRAASRPIVLRGHTGPLFWTMFSPDGTQVVTVGIDGTLRIWNARDGYQIRVLPIMNVGTSNYGKTAVAAFSRDGRYLTAAAGTSVSVWDHEHGDALLATWQTQAFVHDVAFSPDGTTVATADEAGQVVLWDWRHPGTVRRSWRADLGGLYAASFRRDGRQIVTAGASGSATVWDAHTGRQLTVLRGHVGLVFDARFSPDGHQIVTAASDGTLRVWDAMNSEALVTLNGHTNLVGTAEFTASGARILTSSADGTARLFTCEPCASVNQVLGFAHARVFRKFTADERRRFGL